MKEVSRESERGSYWVAMMDASMADRLGTMRVLSMVDSTAGTRADSKADLLARSWVVKSGNSWVVQRVVWKAAH